MTSNQQVRFDQMRTELMVDLYDIMGDADKIDAILNPVEAPEVEALAYAITVPSKSAATGTKTYDATHLSADAGRNVALLAKALEDLGKPANAHLRDDIKAFMQAVIDAL